MWISRPGNVPSLRFMSLTTLPPRVFAAWSRPLSSACSITSSPAVPAARCQVKSGRGSAPRPSLLDPLVAKQHLPGPFLGAELRGPLAAGLGEADAHGVAGQLVDAGHRLALHRSVVPDRVDLLGLLGRVPLDRPRGDLHAAERDRAVAVR